ncbi:MULTISPECIES: flagellar biosynthesis anti-sigma factor FlgM [unclassified Caballeronia]|uniref:flagellar biosynthesis anti-sigma factor FlgM n=1 Tax=unclassified Caballeronia TaxID=2646786 RepID=UPI00158AA6F6|nr:MULTISPECIES: flagellar biosynthesis anti-sigma factor FlgM [unclassified Caballeronia]QSN62739.1 flagellar biosynthesis anti-sigma factor FlgM [Caballeronia sp. M1242]
MKIESNSNTTLSGLQDGLQRASQGDAKTAAPTAQANGSAGQSTVSLSTLSSDLRASNGSDIDTAKVESIKAAIRDGSLKMDTSKIADGILSTARDLLQTRTPPTGG